jgi:hypothetical protein
MPLQQEERIMRFMKSGSALCAAALSVGTAATAATLPPPFAVTEASTSYQQNSMFDFGSETAYSELDGSTEHAKARSSKGSHPTAFAHSDGHASAQASLGSPDHATSRISYNFKVTGPKNQVVQVNYTASGSTSHLDYSPDVHATYSISNLQSNVAVCAGLDYYCATNGYGGSVGSGFNLQGSINVLTNTVYSVQLEAYADATGAGNPDSMTEAQVTSTLALDPAYVGGYELKFSKGISAP